jgi:hypothetical protein
MIIKRFMKQDKSNKSYKKYITCKKNNEKILINLEKKIKKEIKIIL